MAGVTPIYETSSGNKCEKSSNAFRLKGNAHYQKRQFNDALKNYNWAILLAPHNDGSELALGFANRSALFYETSNWKGCLQDIEHALHHRYPAEKQNKLFKRKAQCLIQLERYQEASETLQAKDEVNKSMTIESDEICGATRNVAIKYNNVRGRHLVAKVKIPAGSTIIKEKPYTGVLLPEFHNTHCHQCFTPTEAAIPCPSCSRVRYCSDECQQRSMTLYHWAECPYWNLLQEVGVYAHLSYRILVISGVQTVKGQHVKDTKVSMETSKSIPGCSSSGCYYGNYQSVWNLVMNENMHPSEDIKHFQKISSELIHKTIDHLLGNRTWKRESCEMLDKSHHQDKSCLIGQLQNTHTRHWLQLYCNAQAVTRIVPSNIREGRHRVADVEQRRLATALFPTTSLLNHSCKPNVIVSFKDDEITVRSITTIDTNKEILHCYGPHYKRMKKAERQEALKKQYNFECNCDACRLDDSNADNDLTQETSKENSNKENIKMELSKSMDMFSKANQMLEENKIEGDTSSAVKFLKLSIATVEKWFGPDSIELANELHKLASIQFNMRDVEGAIATINRCLPVLVCHYGNNHESVHELVEMKSTLEHLAL
ncbi:SET and MYND domain-containing protein 4-like isoform X2 [Antedon mediterranea]|uniref:SET and MYND domain-containing protein 4-like isoform X2 n=1 Tax=Antedon mediterranea TaxID=105859 RepID=UPI003AF5C0B2